MIDPILPAVVDRLRSIGALEGATAERVTLGDATLMVELAGVESGTGAEAGTADVAGGSRGSHRTAGFAHRPPGNGRTADALDESTDGVDVETLVRWATRTPGGSSTETIGYPGTPRDGTLLERALGVAAINALSAPFVDWNPGDPMALLDPAVDAITTVGLFRPAFRKFADVDVRVIERTDVGSVSSPDGVSVTTFRPDAASAAMADADVVFVTGSTFVYGGLEAYLEAAPAAATVVLIGATASVLPGPAFAAGVDVVAGASVTETERDRVREAVRAGACGTDLHDAGVRKVYAVADRATGPGQALKRVRNERPDRDDTTND
ncbi:Rossmann-like domain-containing protein [Halosolutus halophilus]|uniref:Rossmann-like domain-containing protein n=1 Tax=Halosolutus halophilus TaxID=1552990 RepID=UPI002235272C|nr:DUF364 domain-containing protein [Halosolutus halophilus]